MSGPKKPGDLLKERQGTSQGDEEAAPSSWSSGPWQGQALGLGRCWQQAWPPRLPVLCAREPAPDSRLPLTCPDHIVLCPHGPTPPRTRFSQGLCMAHTWGQEAGHRGHGAGVRAVVLVHVTGLPDATVGWPLVSTALEAARRLGSGFLSSPGKRCHCDPLCLCSLPSWSSA